MKKKLAFLVALSALLGIAAPQAADARVTRFIVEERVPFAPGTEWGSAGAYERLKGTAYLEVDPADPLNAVIVNLDRAPRNARGLVEFSAPFFILKPVDLKRGNQKLWYGINNRSNCIELGFSTFPFKGTTCNVLKADDIGADHPILQQGFVFADAGWHADALPDPTGARLVPNFPVAVNRDGSPITGPLRIEHVPLADSFTRPLVAENGSSSLVPERTWRPYEPASLRSSDATLTVRDRMDGARTTIAADRWAFGKCASGAASLVPGPADLCLFDSFKAQRIYELTYTAKNPIVMGLAYAVTRDVASFLRYHTQDDAGNANPLAPGKNEVLVRRAYASGTSSTGMYLREFIYLGFNEDERHRRTFDAITINSAGANRLFANVQFAHPTFYSRQDANQDYLANAVAPFTYAVSTDPLTGKRDGLLKRPAIDPLVIQTDEELVFWNWKAALNVADGLGNPVATPDNVRLYFQTGYGHIAGGGLLAPAAALPICQLQSTGVGNAQGGAGVTPRAMVRIIDDWADRGIAPPPSNYPRVENGSLTTLEGYLAAFPAIPGVARPSVINEVDVLDFGPGFDSRGGVLSRLPPLHGKRYQVLVPKPGDDGVALAGIRTVLARAPLGTNVGWNVRTGARAPDLCGLNGSFLPFAKRAADRRGDPRASLEERYRDQEGFVRAVRKAADELVRERFLLEQDAEKYLQAAPNSDLFK